MSFIFHPIVCENQKPVAIPESYFLYKIRKFVCHSLGETWRYTSISYASKGHIRKEFSLHVFNYCE